MGTVKILVRKFLDAIRGDNATSSVYFQDLDNLLDEY